MWSFMMGGDDGNANDCLNVDGMILSLTTFFLHPHRPFSSQGRQPSLSQVRGPWDLGLLCLSADHPDFVRQVLTSNSILTVFKILSLGC